MELIIIIVLLVIGFFINYADKVRDGNATNKANQIFYDRMYDMLEELKKLKIELREIKEELKDTHTAVSNIHNNDTEDDF